MQTPAPLPPMKARDALDMLVLAAVWGASFLFLRIAAPVLGPVAVAAGRVFGAVLLLLPLVIWRGQLAALRPLMPALAFSSLVSYVLPFMGLSLAARSLPAGPLSILNATTPLWGALVGWLWAKEPLGWQRLLGLALGLAGVGLLVSHRHHLDGDVSHQAVALALGSTLMYAIGVHHSKRYLSGLNPVLVSAGSLMCAACLLVGPALWLGPIPLAWQPHHAPGMGWSDVPMAVWAALAALALLCTALAYLLFYRLIQRAGPSRAMSVTFLIPVFGMLWGHFFLHEDISIAMVLSTAVILLGTLLSNSNRITAWPRWLKPRGQR